MMSGVAKAGGKMGKEPAKHPGKMRMGEEGVGAWLVVVVGGHSPALACSR